MVASISYARLQESKDGLNKEVNLERSKGQDTLSARVEFIRKENRTAAGGIESVRATLQLKRIKLYCVITFGILLLLSVAILNVSMRCSHSQAKSQRECTLDKMNYTAPTANQTSTATWMGDPEALQKFLMEAVRRDDDDAIVAAVRCGASVHQLYRNLSPLQLSARLGAVRAAGALLRLGAEVGRPDPEFQMTPLHEAAFDGRPAVARLLLRAGASLSARNNASWTPLHVAAYRGHLNLTRILVEAGAQVNARDGLGQTPLRHALDKGHSSVVSFLKISGGHE